MKELVDGRRARRALLRRQRPDQPGPVPARRQRDLGPGRRTTCRSCDSCSGRARSLSAWAARTPTRTSRTSPTSTWTTASAAGQLPRQLAVAGQDPPDDLRRAAREHHLQRAEAERAGQGVRPRHRVRRDAGRRATSCWSPTAAATCGAPTRHPRGRCTSSARSSSNAILGGEAVAERRRLRAATSCGCWKRPQQSVAKRGGSCGCERPRGRSPPTSCSAPGCAWGIS